ncbi:hypothetical protein AX16_005685 [Volvariella volvacea WC 439]|nr:hypothetical protein AX16_005685 [Volvariella volvacea WC 439]
MGSEDRKSDIVSDVEYGRSTVEKPFILFRPRVYFPLGIILGQLAIFFVAWGFYIATSRQPVALPNYLAEAGRDYPSGITFVVTLISIAFSASSSYLYGTAMRYALAMRLSKPMPLHLVALNVKLSRSKIVLSFRYWTWALLTTLNIIFLGAQTAAWNALFTPRRITIDNEMTGWGLNITDPTFIERLLPSLQSLVPLSDYRPDTLLTTAPLFQSSGSASVNAMLDLPGSFTFNGRSFLNSTKGIMPVFLEETNSTIEAGSIFLPTISLVNPAIGQNGFSTSYTVTQQGLTVDVSCTRRGPAGAEAIVFGQRDDSDLVSHILRYFCHGEEQDLSQITVIARTTNEYPDGSSILIAACNLTEHVSTGYEIVIHGSGFYDFLGTRSCTAVSQVVDVDVHYSRNDALLSAGSIADVITVSEPHAAREVVNVAGVPFIFLQRVFWQNQGHLGNIVGDYFSVMQSQYEWKPDILDRVLEAYLTGVFEFGATLFQAASTQTRGLFFQDAVVDGQMRYELTGTYTTETLGWYHASNGTVPGVLAIPTIVALFSILLAIAAIRSAVSSQPLVEQEYLDPGDLMHIVSTGFPNTSMPPLSRSEGEILDRGRQLTVRLVDARERKGFTLLVE